MTPDLVSVVIPVHNRPGLLREAVASAITQDYRPLEVLIVDDGSTDETSRVAEELAAAQPELVRVFHQERRGPGGARERGRQEARGEFLQYLDSDDLLLPGKLSAQVAGLRENSDCGVSYGWTRYRDAEGTAHPEPWKGTGERRETMFPSFLLSRWWETATPLYRAELCQEAGPWSELTLEEDWEYDCRIAALGVRLHYVPAYVSEHRDHAGSRLSRGEALDPRRLAVRAQAHGKIFEHAVRAGIDRAAPEMRHFSRALFLLARQCGAAGLAAQSRELFSLSRRAAGGRGKGVDYRVYRSMAAVLGWRGVGRLAVKMDPLRSWLRG